MLPNPPVNADARAAGYERLAMIDDKGSSVSYDAFFIYAMD